MFNHARTLLLNLTGDTGFISNCPGEELIPENYLPVVLPQYLNSIRSRLFGANPDRAMLNYRAVQLLQMIAATDLQSYVTQLDTRITYDLNKSGLYSDAIFEPVLYKYSGDALDQLTIVGSPTNPDTSGQSSYNFQVTIVSNSGIKVNIKRLVFPLQENQENLTLNNGLSPEYNLPFSGYSFRLNTLNTNAAWTISGYLRPTLTLPSLFNNLSSISEVSFNSLFGSSPKEPYLTFKNCWQYHPDFAYRLSGLIMALIYRTEELRNA